MGMKYSNCLFYALGRLWKDGGYIIFRKSRHYGGTFHVLWTNDFETVYQFVPLKGTSIDASKNKFLIKFLKILFKGRVKKWSLKRYHRRDSKWKVLP